MLKYYSIASTYLNSGWSIHPLSGSLLRFDSSLVDSFKSENIPPKVLSALNFCKHPYALSPLKSLPSQEGDLEDLNLIKIYKNLSWLRRKNFFCSVFYAGISRPIFLDSIAAMDAITNLYPDNRDPESCLQRTLAVAKTSVSFKKSGVLFIGAQLPLKSLHAWIIEDDIQPDREDRQWINYLPLLALTF